MQATELTWTSLVDNCEMLHGGVKDEDRMAAVDRFQRPDSNVFVFLISRYHSRCLNVY